MQQHFHGGVAGLPSAVLHLCRVARNLRGYSEDSRPSADHRALGYRLTTTDASPGNLGILLGVPAPLVPPDAEKLALQEKIAKLQKKVKQAERTPQDALLAAAIKKQTREDSLDSDDDEAPNSHFLVQ